MDIMTIVGALGAISLLGYGVWHEGALGAFMNMHGIQLVVGGTFCATMINSSLDDVLNSFKAGLGLLFKPKYLPPEEMLHVVTRLATKARQLGVLALEEERKSIDDDG